MKKALTKLNDLQKMLILSIAIGVVLILLSLIGVFLGQVGWLIGVSIGTLIEIVNIVLLYKGSDFVIGQSKPMLFLLSFFARMVLVAIAFLVCVILDFKLHIGAFRNSVWGVLIGLGPMELVTVLIVGKEAKKPVMVESEKENG